MVQTKRYTQKEKIHTKRNIQKETRRRIYAKKAARLLRAALSHDYYEISLFSIRK
jgi:hypothetical protein